MLLDSMIISPQRVMVVEDINHPLQLGTKLRVEGEVGLGEVGWGGEYSRREDGDIMTEAELFFSFFNTMIWAFFSFVNSCNDNIMF